MLLPVAGQQYKMHAVDITDRVKFCRGTLGGLCPVLFNCHSLLALPNWCYQNQCDFLLLYSAQNSAHNVPWGVGIALPLEIGPVLTECIQGFCLWVWSPAEKPPQLGGQSRSKHVQF